MDDYTTAGQFNIVSGQLVELIDPAKGTQLYANVQAPADSSVNKLAVTFTTTPNTYGTFSFSGDAVQWSVPSINRPNLSAWLVCADQQLFINLGPYAYDTPAGCADETVSVPCHFFPLTVVVRDRAHMPRCSSIPPLGRKLKLTKPISEQIHYYNGATAVN